MIPVTFRLIVETSSQLSAAAPARAALTGPAPMNGPVPAERAGFDGLLLTRACCLPSGEGQAAGIPASPGIIAATFALLRRITGPGVAGNE
jgi:hypothetical protein